MRTLWGFLTMMAGAAAFGAALSVAHKPPAPTSWLGVSVGLCVSVLCVILIRLAGRYFSQLIAKKVRPDRQESACRNLYIAAFVWIVVSSIITYYLVKLAV